MSGVTESGFGATASIDPRRVLAIRNLSVTFPSVSGPLRAVDGVSLDVFENETLAIVGESGCGKTMTALSVLGLVPVGGDVAGSIDFDGIDVQHLPARALRHVRGSGISMIFQEPIAALNPVFTIGQQISDVIRAHDATVSRREARARAVDLLGSVGIADAAARVDDHPHTWSGGMCQRAMIAMAIANGPRLVIADEPTTALDVTVQAQVLALLRDARRRTGAATMLITHDLAVVAEMAERVAVMYAGRIVEVGDVHDIFERPCHPYTRGLLASLPRLDGATELTPIPGHPPHLDHVPTGCSFHPRCAIGSDRSLCATEAPPLLPTEISGQLSACHFPDEFEASVAVEMRSRRSPTRTSPLIEVVDLAIRFQTRSGVFRRTDGHVDAVAGVSFDIHQGETLGLVGESGCGKTTTALAVARLVDATSGRILLDGNDVVQLDGQRLREVRRGIQMVFQDPHASLNPKIRIGASIGEPLAIHGLGDRHARRIRVRELLELVGLSELYIDRYPNEFSGGQLQRVGIARALALDPRVLVLDEPVSSLDVSIQAQVLALLDRLQRELGTAYLFISHDLSVVRNIADRVAVMYRGRIVESAPTDDIFERPQHPYTVALLDAIPRPDPRYDRPTIMMADPPAATTLAAGCSYRLRCPRAQSVCESEAPQLLEHSVQGQRTACHFPVGPTELVSDPVGSRADPTHRGGRPRAD